MEKELGVSEARKQLANVIDQVRYRGDNYVILKHGEPAAAIVPMSVYRKWQAEREALFATVREIQQSHQDADPDEVIREALEAQRSIREAAPDLQP